MTISLQRSLRAALWVALTVPVAAMAAGSATISSGGQNLSLQWQDTNNVRFKAAKENNYMLLKDGNAYSVSSQGGTPQVINLSGMTQMFAGMAKDAAGDDDFLGEISSIKASGKNETVAGIKGKVYQMTVTDANGKTTQQEAVLTGNSSVVEMTDAYLSFITALAGKENLKKFTADLPAGKRGLLRVGDDFRLASISTKSPSAAAFKLPAKPKDMSKMMQGFGQQMKQMGQQMQQR